MMKRRKKLSIYFCIIYCVLFTTACTSNNTIPDANTNNCEETDTGSFKKGGFKFSDYWIDLECPYTGHPFGTLDSLWSTYYEDENGERVYVDIFGIEENSDGLIEELTTSGIKVTEDILWDNECYFYTDNVTVAIIPLEKNDYLQIVFEHEAGLLVERLGIPDTFTLEIRKYTYAKKIS